jgi:hypothetical protein
MIHVFQHKDSRRRASEDVFPQIASIMEMVTTNRRFASPEACCYGVSDHRRLIWEDATQFPVGKPRIPQSNTKRLDRVCNHAGIELAQGVELRLGQQPPTIHAGFLSDAVLFGGPVRKLASRLSIFCDQAGGKAMLQNSNS